MNLKPQSILAAVVALSLALPGAAMADRRGHDGYQKGHSSGYGHKGYKHHYRDRHHYPKHRRGYTTKHHYYHDDGDDLLIGLVVGGILGYALNSAQQTDSVAYDRYPPAASAYPATDTYRYSDNSCLQEREYQTTVVVGGKQVEAYGTACLQPDGSWSRGPAQLVNY
jgi:hypothetical protein